MMMIMMMPAPYPDGGSGREPQEDLVPRLHLYYSPTTAVSVSRDPDVAVGASAGAQQVPSQVSVQVHAET